MLAAAAVVARRALVAVPLLNTSVIPSLKDRDLLVHLDAEPGTSQPEMTQIAAPRRAKLEPIQGVRDVGAHIGRAVTGDQIVDVNSGELWVNIDRDADYDETVADVQRVVAGLGASITTS